MFNAFEEVVPHTIWECYSPEYMRPADREDCSSGRKDFVGWDGFGLIAFLSDMDLWQDD